MIPTLAILTGLATLFFLLISYFQFKLSFSAEEVQQHKDAWLATEAFHLLEDYAETKSGLHAAPKLVKQLVDQSLKDAKFLSPAYIKGMLGKNEDQRRTRRILYALISVYAEMDAADLAKIFAAAFLKSPCETLRAGVALAVFANRRAQASRPAP